MSERTTRCMGAGVGQPCDEPAQLSYVLPVCTDHQAAVLYKLERGGFSFDRQDVDVTPGLDEKDRERLGQLARYLCASLLANNMRISLGYALKKYVPETPEDSWFLLARDVLDGSRRAMDARFRTVLGDGPEDTPF